MLILSLSLSHSSSNFLEHQDKERIADRLKIQIDAMAQEWVLFVQSQERVNKLEKHVKEGLDQEVETYNENILSWTKQI